MYDVVGIATPCMDFAMNVDRLPTHNGGARLENYSFQGGGKIATGMVAAARLGAKCALLGTCGDDIFGKACYADFVRHGIAMEKFTVQTGATTDLSLVMSDRETAGRSIMYKPGTCGRLSFAQLDKSLLEDCRYFFISGFSELALEAASYAKAHGARIFIDADGYQEGMEAYIPLIDVFVASEFVYNGMFKSEDYEANCKAVLDMGPSVVVFTFGEKGCVGMDREGFFTLPAFRVEAVDTVGAGDVFHGAFLAGLLRGWSTKEIARFSSAVSAIKCTRPGGRAGIPSAENALQFIRTGTYDTGELDERTEYYQRGLEHV